MARPMNPLPTSDGEDSPLVDFASTLRTLRARAGAPTLTEMAQRSGVCTASLSDAHNGRALPTWRTVHGYVRACGGDPALWRSRWEGVRLAQRTGHAEDRHAALMSKWARTRQLTPPQWVKSEAELARLLDHMRRFRGLSLRDMARQSGGFSHHTFAAVLRGDRPVTADILMAILRACSVDPGAAQRWLSALGRVRPAEALRVQTYNASIEKYRRTRLAGGRPRAPRQDRQRNGFTPMSKQTGVASRITSNG
ncbi:helix-turn-helix domain-containing protein [Streptomyces sp. Rer75]|uniref:helix-turn-helix domain-containing protein n=1 Tax=Streptomyces sp. Rer75 TaxID=2750011 RepID=UPI0015D04637|nr:helix-turn-helix domain-containing protein [Streptomyces sp. Rer75]QLH19287.1 transcriptional regulator [Streptomyces sp. Rer75]